MPRSIKRRTVELPLEIHAKLQEEADRQGLTTATALVIAVREWLDRQGARVPGRVRGDEA